MNDTHEELRQLITDVVTGDGAQLENLTMTDDEWRKTAREQTGDDMLIVINLPVEQWIELLDVARNHTDTYPEE